MHVTSYLYESKLISVRNNYMPDSFETIDRSPKIQNTVTTVKYLSKVKGAIDL